MYSPDEAQYNVVWAGFLEDVETEVADEPIADTQGDGNVEATLDPIDVMVRKSFYIDDIHSIH